VVPVPPLDRLNHYHRYRLFPRVDDFNTIFRAMRLFQQYVVDAAATIEQNRLTWYRIRADMYKGLEDGHQLRVI
jgi:Helitron helicase-like domain at N-terminus